MEVDNPNWMGGISDDYYRKQRPLLVARDGEMCWSCKCTNKPIEIHHLDEDRKHNQLDNMRLLCKSCHTKAHGKIKSLANRTSNRRLPDIKCQTCQKLFRPRQATIKFCSRACKGKAHSLLMTQHAPRKCEICGDEFKPKDENSRFCSKTCFGVSWSAEYRARIAAKATD